MTAVTSAEERAAPDAQAGILASVALAANYNRWLLDRARPYLGARVLDSGAGIGTFTELLTDRELVVAAEPDPAFAGLLRDRFARRPNVQIVELDALALSPTSVPAPFDSVVCLNVLEHIRADEDALARLASVLRPDGHLLLLVPAHPTLFAPSTKPSATYGATPAPRFAPPPRPPASRSSRFGTSTPQARSAGS